MLDFVPHHMGLGPSRAQDHPEYFIQGSELDMARAPQNYTWVHRKRGDLLLAYGPRPLLRRLARYVATQLRQSATQEVMIGELTRIAEAMRRRSLRHGDAGAARCL